MKILVINGSPRGERSNTSKVTRAFLKGMGEKAHWVDAYSANIHPCTGCFSCWNETPGRCAVRDDMDEIIEAISGAELMIWSTPQYSYGMPSPLKAVMDRLLPLSTGGQAVNEEGRISHVLRVKYPRAMLISGCGFADSRFNCEPLIMQFDYFFGRDCPHIYCAQSPLFSIPNTERITRPYLSAAEQAGSEFAQTGCISSGTQDRLDDLMLPAEMYRKMVNLAAEHGHRIG